MISLTYEFLKVGQKWHFPRAGLRKKIISRPKGVKLQLGEMNLSPSPG